MIIDGGKTHLKQVLSTFKDQNISDINVISISKGIRRKATFDIIHLPNGEKIDIDQGSAFSSICSRDKRRNSQICNHYSKEKMRKSTIKSSIDELSGMSELTSKNDY